MVLGTVTLVPSGGLIMEIGAKEVEEGADALVTGRGIGWETTGTAFTGDCLGAIAAKVGAAFTGNVLGAFGTETVYTGILGVLGLGIIGTAAIGVRLGC
jgi:hypothetical protein